MKKRDFKILNRDAIKYIAAFTMLLNHIAHIFMVPGTVVYDVFEGVGYFTAITMCYFLVEGYKYTHSKRKYGLRLLVFAVISQFAFSFAFTYSSLNMIYTLFLCFLILAVMENVLDTSERFMIVIVLVLLTGLGDCPILAAVYTILFAKYKDSRSKMISSYLIALFLSVGLNLFDYVRGPDSSVMEFFLRELLSGIAILASGVVILFFYNGRRAEHGRGFSKLFFYIFYPGHLFVLGLLKRLM